MTVVVEGLAGMGKTWFLRELMRLASADGRWTVGYTSGDEIEQHEPYGFVERLLAGPWFDRTAMGVLDDPQVQPLAVGRALLRMRQEGTDPGHVVVIDDAQWLDPESARVLRHVLPRIARQDVMIVVGVRSPHAPASLGEHLVTVATSNPHDEVVTVEPLGVAEIRSHAAERLGTTISTRSAERLHRATGGSFLLVEHVLSQLTSNEIAQLHMAWDIPLRGITAAENPFLAGYRDLGPEARATAEIVCVAQQELTRSDLAVVAEHLAEPLRTDAAVAAGVLVESGFGSTVGPVHALVAHAVREALPAERTREVCRALAEVTEGYSSIHFQLSAATELDDALLGRVREYVTEALVSRAFTNAGGVLRRTLALVPDADDPRRHELLTDLGLLHLQNKSMYLLLDLVDDFERLPSSMLRELLCIALAAYHPEMPFPLPRVFGLLTQPATTGDEATLQAYLSFLLTIMTMRGTDYSQVGMLLEQATARVAHAAGVPPEDPRLAWMVDPEGYTTLLASIGTVLLQRDYAMGQLREVLPPLVVRARALSHGPLQADALTTLAGSAAHSGNLELARDLAGEAVSLLDHVDKPWMAGTARIILADCLVLQGDYPAATELLTEIAEVAHDTVDLEVRPMQTALAAVVAAHTGQPGAAEMARQSAALHQFDWEGFGPDFAVLAGCEVARVAGDPEGVLAAIDAAPVASMVNTRRGFLTHRVHALVDLGRLDEAAALTAELAEWQGTRWQECWGSLSWLQARLAAACGDLDAAETFYRAAVERDDIPPLPTALTLADHGTLLAGRGRTEQARTQWTAAQQILRRIGARPYLARVERALRELRSARQDERERVIAELTGREREIARHLAAGRSNQQIADALVVTVATVRFHVSNVLHKLQITSRAEVGRVLRGSSLDPG